MVTSIRIRREFFFFEENLNLMGIELFWDGTDNHHLTATITGPESTPYEGGIFNIDITLPELYPYEPPVMRFLTKVWHPNIDSENGVVSLSTLKEGGWTCAMNLETALISLQELLSIPDVTDPQDVQILNQYLNEHAKFNRKARSWTQIHATSHDDSPAPSE